MEGMMDLEYGIVEKKCCNMQEVVRGMVDEMRSN
jgi:hypothetical protein